MSNSTGTVNFQGRLVTNLSGRHNIMYRVSENFAKKTEHISGELLVKRGARYENPGSIVLSNGHSSYVISDYDKLMGNNFKSPSDITEKVVNNISKTFVNFFKALNFETKFVEKNKNLVKSIRSLERTVAKYEAHVKYAIQNNNDPLIIKRFTTVLDSYKNKLAKLKKEFAENKAIFIEGADKLTKKSPELETWRQVVGDIEEYI